MHSILRPNYRRARALALEIEAARVHLDEARSGSSDVIRSDEAFDTVTVLRD